MCTCGGPELHVCVCVCVCVWMHLPTHCSGRPVFHLAKGSSDLTPHLVMTHHMEHKDEETLEGGRASKTRCSVNWRNREPIRLSNNGRLRSIRQINASVENCVGKMGMGHV